MEERKCERERERNDYECWLVGRKCLWVEMAAESQTAWMIMTKVNFHVGN